MFITPKENSAQTPSEDVASDKIKSQRINLNVLGASLLVIILVSILWYVFHSINTLTTQTTEEAVVPGERTLSEEEMLQKRLEALAAETIDQEPLSEEEVQEQLEMMKARETESVLLTEEEVPARLEALEVQETN